MPEDEDIAYFTSRAAQEQRMAERSTDLGAQDAHRRMAELYAARASGQDRRGAFAWPAAMSGPALMQQT